MLTVVVRLWGREGGVKTGKSFRRASFGISVEEVKTRGSAAGTEVPALQKLAHQLSFLPAPSPLPCLKTIYKGVKGSLETRDQSRTPGLSLYAGWLRAKPCSAAVWHDGSCSANAVAVLISDPCWCWHLACSYMTFLSSISRKKESKYLQVQLQLERTESGFVAQTYVTGNTTEAH